MKRTFLILVLVQALWLVLPSLLWGEDDVAATLKAQLALAHKRVEAREFPAARVEFGKILADKTAPAHYRANAQLCIAQTYVREKKYAQAASEFAKVQVLKDIPAHLRWEAKERKQEAERVNAGLPARDPASSRTQLPKRGPAALQFYVATDGNDANPGTKQRPFATLERARDAAAGMMKKGDFPAGPIEVLLRKGAYPLKKTFRLGAENSGTQSTPIVYRPFQGEKVVLSGGTAISGFTPVKDNAILARLPEAARGHVMQLDLKAKGFTDFGTMKPRGFGCKAQPVLELFFNGKPMQPARWPNQGTVKTGKVIDPKSTFEYEGDRPARWTHARDIWMDGYWYHLWAGITVGVDSIDAEKQQIKTASAPHYGIRAGHPYYYYNLLEEIDLPGEWYLDRPSAILYFYPPSDPAKAVVQISMLDGPLVQLDDVSHVSLERLTLELGRGSGVVIDGGSDCRVVACTLCRLGGDAVIVNGGTNHGILGCDLHTLGRGGARLQGGNRKTLAPGGHFIENCHVFDFSRLDRTYTPAVWMDGCGNRIAHNLFHHNSCHAMRIEGNDHLIEFNEIHHVNLESDDQGGLDMWGNASYRGNIIRYNYWHHIGGTGNLKWGRAGVRLDDAICGTLVYGNVFYRSSDGHFGGVQIHGGKDNWVDNNIFIECKYGVSFSPWGPKRWKSTLARPDVIAKLTKQVDIHKPPYSTRYPGLARLNENPDANNIWRNVVYKCGGFLGRDRGVHDLMDNYVTDEDPGFVRPLQGDFRLKSDSPVFDKTGFRSIPFDEIGLYKDKCRASWPPSEGVSENRSGEPQVLRIFLKADADGGIAALIMDGETIAQPKDGKRTRFDVLQSRIRNLVEDSAGRRKDKCFEAELQCDYALKYEHAIQAFSAISGRISESGEVIKLVDKIKFSPPRREPNGNPAPR